MGFSSTGSTGRCGAGRAITARTTGLPGGVTLAPCRPQISHWRLCAPGFAECGRARAAIQDIREAPSALRAALAGLDQPSSTRPTARAAGRCARWRITSADSHLNAYIRTQARADRGRSHRQAVRRSRRGRCSRTAKLPVEVSLRLLDAVHERWLVLLESLSETAVDRGPSCIPRSGADPARPAGSRSIPGTAGITSRKSRRCGNAWAGRVMAWIKTVDPDDASGPLKAEYARAFARAGRLWNILDSRVSTPKLLKASTAFYLAHHVWRLARFRGGGGRCWPWSSPAPTGAAIELMPTRTTSGARSPISG